MKRHCWNGPSPLATGLPEPAHGAFHPRPRQGSPEALDGGVDFGERRCGEVGSWVGEMAGEVGDPIWLPAKEEAHQRAVSTGARLGRRGTTVRGDVQWWRSVARGSGRWLGHRRLLGQRRRSTSVAGGG
jgi:hypothetical protein